MNEIVWKTPIASTAFLEDAKFSTLSGRICSLEYIYENETNYSVVFEKLLFGDVESFKCTYYKACSLEMLDAYDKVMIINNSKWLAEVVNNLSENHDNPQDLKHLRIYFDEGPCYEFICRTFEVINGERKD